MARSLGIKVDTMMKYLEQPDVLDKWIETDRLLTDRDYLEERLTEISLSELARSMGISRLYLTKHINQHGIQVESLPSDVVKVLRDADMGSVDETAVRLGVSPATVRKYWRKRGRVFEEQHKLSDDVSDLLNDINYVKDLVADTTITDAANNLGVNRQTFQNYCTKHNIKKPRIGSSSSLDILSNKETLSGLMDENSLSGLAKRLGVDPTTVGNYCRRHGIAVPQSSYEAEIATWLTQEGIEYRKSDRTVIRPLEIDFFVCDASLAIEFNGIYWHSDKFLDQHYHAEKLQACKRENVSLIMINEDEWLQRSSAIKNTILHRLHRGERGIPARKMALRSISSSTANDFFSKHHIQGMTSAIISAIGGFDDETLIAAMAFSKQRGTGDVELVRFCSDGRSHAGAFSRLFHHSAETNGYQRIISFADKRYSSGDVYQKNGFLEVGHIPPDYRYVMGNSTHHKSNFTRTRIAKRFGIDMSLHTERSAMRALGYHRIYDCGKIKFEWSKPN